jgi:hypothetical protein
MDIIVLFINYNKNNKLIYQYIKLLSYQADKILASLQGVKQFTLYKAVLAW